MQGAGVAALMAIKLHHALRDAVHVHCWAFSPPGALMSPALAAAVGNCSVFPPPPRGQRSHLMPAGSAVIGDEAADALEAAEARDSGHGASGGSDRRYGSVLLSVFRYVADVHLYWCKSSIYHRRVLGSPRAR